MSKQIFDEAIHRLAWEEGDIPRLCRTILRMRRDDADAAELERLMKPLFFSIIEAVLKSETPGRIDIDCTPELQALLKEQRKTAKP